VTLGVGITGISTAPRPGHSALILALAVVDRTCEINQSIEGCANHGKILQTIPRALPD
jgi:hypothetical protein